MKSIIILSLVIVLISCSKLKRNPVGCMPSNINEETKKKIVDLHNQYRNQVATGTTELGNKLPYATNMNIIFWDDNLAKSAQTVANKCLFEHSTDKERTITNPNMKLGENLFLRKTSGKEAIDFTIPIKQWFKEIYNMNVDLIKNFQPGGPDINEFSQMINAKTYLIGCAVSVFQENSKFDQLYVCHYGHAGNQVGKPVYNVSEKLECKCLTAYICDHPEYRGLCCNGENCKKEIYRMTGPHPKLNYP
jgi:hypothetical protein